MERVLAADANVRGLATLLGQPAPVAVQQPGGTADPAAEMEHERQRLFDAARQEGYAAGIADAERKIGEAMEDAGERLRQAHAAETESLAMLNQRLGELLKSFAQASADVEALNETCVLEMTYSAVVRFLGHAAADGTLIQSVCRKALDEYRQRPVILRVSPEDVAPLKELATEAEIAVEADSRLGPGQCRLQTRKGDYDTSLEVRLDALKHAFLRSLGPEEASA